MRGAWETVYFEAGTTTLARETPHFYPKPQGYGFMSLLTYNVFNLYSFIRYGAYNSHLYTTIIISPLNSTNYMDERKKKYFSTCHHFHEDASILCTISYQIV